MTAIISAIKTLFETLTADPIAALVTGNAGTEIGLPILIIAAIGFIEFLFGLKLLRLEMLA